jgi:hypothetical protein
VERQYERADRVVSAVANGRVYFASGNTNVYAYALTPPRSCAHGVAEPALELLGSPSPPTDEQQPDVGMVKGPEDVGGSDVETGRGALLVQVLDDPRWFA